MRIYKRRIDLTGQRQGRLVALRPATNCGWIVRCDCGKVYRVHLSAWKGYYRPGVRSCMDCRDPMTYAKSVKLADGVTVARVAELAGLKTDTVYHRFIRGWPRHKLGQATQRRSA